MARTATRFVPVQAPKAKRPAPKKTIKELDAKIETARRIRDLAVTSANEQIEAMEAERTSLITAIRNTESKKCQEKFIQREQQDKIAPMIRDIKLRINALFATTTNYPHFRHRIEALPAILAVIPAIVNDFYIMDSCPVYWWRIEDYNQHPENYHNGHRWHWIDQRISSHKQLKRGQEHEHDLSAGEAVAFRLFDVLGANTSTEMILGLVRAIKNTKKYCNVNISVWRKNWCRRTGKPVPDNRTYNSQPDRNMIAKRS